MLPDASERADERRGPLRGYLVVALVALVGWGGMLAWQEHQLGRELAALGDPERQALYRHGMDELRTVCRAHGGLGEHCAEEARLLRRLPECDAECRALTAKVLGGGSQR